MILFTCLIRLFLIEPYLNLVAFHSRRNFEKISIPKNLPYVSLLRSSVSTVCCPFGNRYAFVRCQDDRQSVVVAEDNVPTFQIASVDQRSIILLVFRTNHSCLLLFVILLFVMTKVLHLF